MLPLPYRRENIVYGFAVLIVFLAPDSADTEEISFAGDVPCCNRSQGLVCKDVKGLVPTGSRFSQPPPFKFLESSLCYFR